MAEKRGLFGKLFGRKDKTPAEAGPPHEEPDAREEAARDENEAEARAVAADELADNVFAETAPLEDEAELRTPHRPAPPPEDDAVPQDDQGEMTAPAAPEPEPAAPPADASSADPLEEASEAPVTDPPAPAPTTPTDRPTDTPAEKPTDQPTDKPKGFFGRLRSGLAKTSAKLSGGIGTIFTKKRLDDDTLEELEDLLIMADIGVPTTTRIITQLAKDKFDQEVSGEDIRAILSREIETTLAPLEAQLAPDGTHGPHVILMTGVNGAGKTTTIGKLAQQFTAEGKSVLLAACDTFRAAAIEQLTVWGERVGVPVISREQGADPAALAYDAVAKAQAEGIDIVLIDTAGRLQNRRELMDELGKIVRVVKKLDDSAPHDAVLVLDATVGQNALSQTEAFLETAKITGLIMTKLDGTARGGVLVALGDKFGLPIHAIGVGETVEDLQPFRASAFAAALTAAAE
ncbi:FtsY, signal recognition particle-docking protein [Parvularcula bermudensis HTCC2503]|uniref:Signal recognition particle receptor FtsY n=1 Tax=Parvularcula bermudensis (strain ATCC BAA-594 / HTCC2503 / KCTC 12087) TaxID=314260 RepID=E0TEK7_PARBH|nr:signal recognition particle-docking protein FtsY [Parvularcula bermudensis]ADM08890.1 FtsY, signal recognition particle-docking protein [Parvularcula bermudensis HTCC2503]